MDWQLLQSVSYVLQGLYVYQYVCPPLALLLLAGFMAVAL